VESADLALIPCRAALKFDYVIASLAKGESVSD